MSVRDSQVSPAALAGHRLELLTEIDQIRGVDGRRERDAGGRLRTLHHPLGDRPAGGGDGDHLEIDVDFGPRR